PYVLETIKCALFKILEGSNEEKLRRKASQALINMKLFDKNSIEWLLKFLQSEKHYLRDVSVNIIRHNKYLGEEIIKGLLKIIKDSRVESILKATIECLGSVKNLSNAYLPILLETLSHPSVNVKIGVVKA